MGHSAQVGSAQEAEATRSQTVSVGQVVLVGGPKQPCPSAAAQVVSVEEEVQEVPAALHTGSGTHVQAELEPPLLQVWRGPQVTEDAS
jgi:hypothetical protein